MASQAYFQFLTVSVFAFISLHPPTPPPHQKVFINGMRCWDECNCTPIFINMLSVLEGLITLTK